MAATALQSISTQCKDQMTEHFQGLVQIVQAMDTFNLSTEAAIGLLKGGLGLGLWPSGLKMRCCYACSVNFLGLWCELTGLVGVNFLGFRCDITGLGVWTYRVGMWTSALGVWFYWAQGVNYLALGVKLMGLGCGLNWAGGVTLLGLGVNLVGLGCEYSELGMWTYWAWAVNFRVCDVSF